MFIEFWFSKGESNVNGMSLTMCCDEIIIA